MRVQKRVAGRRNGRRTVGAALLAAAAVAWSSATASAQLDPLLFIKRVPPTVIIVVDTSLSMLTDGNCRMPDSTCTFYDPGFWPTSDPVAIGAFPTVDATAATYRRKYSNFNYAVSGSGNKFVTSSITGITAQFRPSTDTSIPAADQAFLDPTRYGIVKAGIASAVQGNLIGPRWGLITLRQKSPSWPTQSFGSGSVYVGGSGCTAPVANSDAVQQVFNDDAPCHAAAIGTFGVYAPTVSAANYLQGPLLPAGVTPVKVSPSNGSGSAVLVVVNRPPGDSAGLIPAGQGNDTFEDRPLSYALSDAKTAVTSVISADAASTRACRNTIVVLITGGQDEGNATYLSTNDVTSVASQFRNLSVGGTTYRVPIHVIAVKAADAAKSQLRTIATNSGGVYHDATTSMDVAAWIDYAVQAGYGRQGDFTTGAASSFSSVSPIVGTVNLEDANDATGTPLSNTLVYRGGVEANGVLPQRSNMLLTGSFELPGFYGRLRAFRVYRPVADSTQPSGYKFVNDGTRLWPDLDGRPDLAGQARTPADPNTRNIFTWVPDASGTGGAFLAFTTANASTLTPMLNLQSGISASDLITFVRAQPLGAIIGSTPAVMDPPSLDPPPDVDYGRADTPDTFAGDHASRRSIIFVGANDGMMHAIDARTGYEIWAYIPYNLLPKLQALYDGQPVDRYEYFVDSSPKIAEVKLDPTNSDPAKRWHSLLLFGEGPGGLFYQAFDVTEAGMGVDPTLDGTSAVTALLTKFADASATGPIQFKWAFPNFAHFDPTIQQTFTLSDGTPGNALTLWGDLSTTKSGARATPAELTVGFTWSDPAVGPLTTDRSVNAIVVGSGYFPAIESSAQLARGGASAPAAGNALYLIDAGTGALIGNASGAACTGTGCLSVGDVSNGRKNALQADPTAAGEYSSPVVTRAYLGDIDGKYWRFNFTSSGAITNTQMVDTGKPIYASSALLFVGSTDVYMFVATGSDSLAGTTSGGTGTFKLYGLRDSTSGPTTQFSISLASTTASGNLVTGERASTSPTVAGDIVFFTTTTESASTPCSDFSANLYATTYLGTAAYDSYTSGNGKIDNNESKIVRTVAGRATAPFIVDQHLYFGTAGTTGANVQAFGDPEDFNNGVGQVGVRILSWREIR